MQCSLDLHQQLLTLCDDIFQLFGCLLVLQLQTLQTCKLHRKIQIKIKTIIFYTHQLVLYISHSQGGGHHARNLAMSDNEQNMQQVTRIISDITYGSKLIIYKKLSYSQRKRASNMALLYGAEGISIWNRLGIDHECDRQTA